MARILVIDDEEPIRKLLRTVLERAGFEVMEAENGARALELHAESPADVVITDILMPEKDGVEVIVALRLAAPDIKVIAMSGGGKHGQVQALDIAEPLGAFATLRKPFDLGVMVEFVNLALSVSSSKSRSAA